MKIKFYENEEEQDEFADIVNHYLCSFVYVKTLFLEGQAIFVLRKDTTVWLSLDLAKERKEK